jgi:2-keto-4-pentenoate hydratase/2-oxohepta-3-ene-1,7-dioic acid hydratase in catechol pathway
MRLCRIGPEAAPKAAFYFDTHVVPVASAAVAHSQARGTSVRIPTKDDLIPLLGDFGLHETESWLARTPNPPGAIPIAQAELLVPVAKPNKIFCLAGNYAEHVKEGGGTPAERAQTFPYVFMKPPSTTLNHPNKPVLLPKAAPDAVDWELELAVVIGRKVKGVSEAEALRAVAGYTIINDISQRRYRPNPGRKPRDRDKFFDWLHGKWFDSFCPCGPCVASADEIADPQSLRLTLKLNGQVRQDASTAQMIFPVAAVIAFISQMVTLEPGDLISTGTPAGVGSTTGTFLKPGDVMHGTIERIGTLTTPVAAE